MCWARRPPCCRGAARSRSGFSWQLGDPGHGPQVGTEEQQFMGRRGHKGQSPLNHASLPTRPGCWVNCPGWCWARGPVLILTSELKLLMWCGHLPVLRGRPWVQGVHPCRSDPGEGGGLEGHVERTSPAPPPLPCAEKNKPGLFPDCTPRLRGPALPLPPSTAPCHVYRLWGRRGQPVPGASAGVGEPSGQERPLLRPPAVPVDGLSLMTAALASEGPGRRAFVPG